MVSILMCLAAGFAAGEQTDLAKLKSLASEQENAVRTCYFQRVVETQDFTPVNVPDEVKAIDPSFETRKKADRNVIIRQEVWHDRTPGQWRIVNTDLRDLKALASKFDLGDRKFICLSQSSESLLGNDCDYFVHLTHSSDPWVMCIWPTMGSSRWPSIELPNGIVLPKHLNTDGASVAIVPAEGCPGGPILGDPSSAEIVYELDREFPSRFCKLDRRHKDGSLLRRQLLSDFRRVNGLLCPFIVEEQTWGRDGKMRKRVLTKVEKVCFNEKIEAGSLRIAVPAGVKIADFVSERKVQFGCPCPLEVSLDNVFDVIKTCRDCLK